MVREKPARTARRARLRYAADDGPGIRRRRQGAGFIYLTARGKRIRGSATLARIRALAIPPAWTDVWISPRANGHLQATGRDARGRKQYSYHPRWRETRDASKYDDLLTFARLLPKIRQRVARDLRRRHLSREKVLATMVRLLELTLIRVGNEEYAKHNRSYGLSTMHDGHARVNGARVSFSFRGKSGIKHELDLQSPQLARIVRHCQDLPGQQLFQYVDDEGKVCDVSSSDVNDYLRQISGHDVTAKDFRTWAGTTLAAHALQEFQEFDTQSAAKKSIMRAIERVAERLGNTKTVCRKCYIHPAIFDAYLDRSLTQVLKQKAERLLRNSLGQLKSEEAAVLALLQARMKRDLAKH